MCNNMLFIIFALISGGSSEANSFGRIVGGQVVNSRSYEFPFFMSVMHRPQPGVINGSYCGGALVNELYVVTAGHCLQGTKSKRISVFTSKGKFLDPSTVLYNVEKVILHPGYKGTGDLDIGLLKLKEPVKTGTKGPSPLCQHNNKDFRLRPGHSATIIGRGLEAQDDGARDRSLKKLQVKLESAKYCRNTLGRPSYEFCTSAPGRKTWAHYGDSGGPVIVYHKGHARSIGVVSKYIGLQNGGGGWLNAIAKLSSAYDWIVSVVRQDSRVKLCKV